MAAAAWALQSAPAAPVWLPRQMTTAALAPFLTPVAPAWLPRGLMLE